MKKFNYELDYSRIKELRINNNLTQKDLAEILNIKKPTYTQFETMKRDLFPISLINDVANYFNVSIDYLLNLSNNNYSNSKKELDSIIAGKRLKEIRKENKLYQETLAKDIGVTNALICEYEKGKKQISLTVGYAICKRFNISMDYLLGKIDEPKYLK